MFAKAKALDARKQEMERLRAEKLRQNSMSPHEKRIQDRLRQQVQVILVVFMYPCFIVANVRSKLIIIAGGGFLF